MRNYFKRLISIMLAVVLIIGVNTTSIFAAGSTLKISGNTAITSIEKGKGTSVTGTITSNYRITNVTGVIKDSSGKVKYSKSVNPKSKKYVLKRSAIDKALKFGKLAEGSYTYTLSATDSSGKTSTLVSNNFTVAAAPSSKTASALKITDAVAPGTITKGSIWHCTGVITSNYNLKSVTGKILDASGKIKSAKTVKLATVRYALTKSAIDNALTFSKLAVGTYHYEISATDASGKTLKLVDETFTVAAAGTTDTEVKESEKTDSEKTSSEKTSSEKTSSEKTDSEKTESNEPSTLKISNVTALTTTVQGKYWHCNGTISSNYKINSIIGQITTSTGTAKYTKIVAPNTLTYELRNSKIDNALGFSKLPAGTYRYTIKATDTSGQTLVLVDNTFTVK